MSETEIYTREDLGFIYCGVCEEPLGAINPDVKHLVKGTDFLCKKCYSKLPLRHKKQ